MTVATICSVCGGPLPKAKPRGVRLAYCTDPCRKRARLLRQRMRRPARKPPPLRRRCVSCSVVISFLDVTWLPTSEMCPRHLDLAHCVDHCEVA